MAPNAEGRPGFPGRPSQSSDDVRNHRFREPPFIFPSLEKTGGLMLKVPFFSAKFRSSTGHTNAGAPLDHETFVFGVRWKSMTEPE